MNWYLKIISWLLGGVTIAVALVLTSEMQNPYWLLLLLLNFAWCFIFLAAETWKEERKEGVRVK